jgi:4'-phosphopantetheinyl transferase
MSDRRQVVVWSWNLNAGSLVDDAAEALLSEEERDRRQRFVSPDLGRRFLAARAGLRLLLGRHLDRDPRSLTFVVNAFGKPRLADGDSVHFNLSHSGERAVLAISDGPVGIDLEAMRPIEHLDLATRYFHPHEVAAITGPRDENEQRRAFFLVWTLKEAVVKAVGDGLSIPLNSFEVSIASLPPAMVLAPKGAPTTWWLQSKTVDGGYCLALAVPGVAEVGLTHRTL